MVPGRNAVPSRAHRVPYPPSAKNYPSLRTARFAREEPRPSSTAVRFIIVAEDRHPHPIFCQADRLSQKLPAELDGVFLEVVAEGKVPQHFKERMMASGIADIFQIVVLSSRTEALLHSDRSLVGACVFAEEHTLELVHPGVGEEQGRIGLRNQGGTRHSLMAMQLEISNEGLS